MKRLRPARRLGLWRRALFGDVGPDCVAKRAFRGLNFRVGAALRSSAALLRPL